MICKLWKAVEADHKVSELADLADLSHCALTQMLLLLLQNLFFTTAFDTGAVGRSRCGANSIRSSSSNWIKPRRMFRHKPKKQLGKTTTRVGPTKAYFFWPTFWLHCIWYFTYWGGVFTPPYKCDAKYNVARKLAKEMEPQFMPKLVGPTLPWSWPYLFLESNWRKL